jgi:hypothetical protein
VPFTPDGVIFSRPRLLTTVSHQDLYYRAKTGRLHRIHRGVYPRYNVLVAGLTVDVFWPEWKLVVELDGRPYHSSPRSYETDRIRDATRRFRSMTSASCASPVIDSTTSRARSCPTSSRSGG